MSTEYDENATVLTFDVEWANPTVLNEVLTELDTRNLKATFFCTHEGIETPGHERALHPNFRRDGDTLGQLKAKFGGEFDTLSDDDLIRMVLTQTREFCPEATGIRTHSLFFELKLMAIMKEMDFLYDSSCLLPLQGNVCPFSAMWGVTEIPIYYMDHLDLVNEVTSFNLEELKLEQKGLKVFNFHPTLIYLNAENDHRFQSSKSTYTDPDALLKQRFLGRGTRSLFLDLLDDIATKGRTTMTMTEVATSWASANK